MPSFIRQLILNTATSNALSLAQAQGLMASLLQKAVNTADNSARAIVTADLPTITDTPSTIDREGFLNSASKESASKESASKDLAFARLAAWQGGIQAFSCSIINAKSGLCAENCSFCAQSSHYTTKSKAYPLLDASTLYKHAERLASRGVTYMGIVTSGTSPSKADFDSLCETAALITANLPIKLCASLGVVSLEEALLLKEAGFTSYHHNLETAASYYPKICTTHTYETRLNTVKNLLQSGLRVCSGGIFGLGESWEQRIELAHCLSSLGVNSIPINFLMPIPGTPLENREPLSPTEALHIIALFRLMNPKADIVLCGGSSQTLKQWKALYYQAGANGLMVGDYLTTKGADLDADMALVRSVCPKEKFKVAGLGAPSSLAQGLLKTASPSDSAPASPLDSRCNSRHDSPPLPHQGLLITGTGTDIGKTLVTAALLRALQASGTLAHGLKVIQTGCLPGGDGQLIAPDVQRYTKACPQGKHRVLWCFEPACSPHLAARQAKTPLSAVQIAQSIEQEKNSLLPDAFMCVEGSGGVMVPINEQETFLDVFALLGLPALMVCPNELGCVNHALLTAHALRGKSIPLLGFVLTSPKKPQGTASTRTKTKKSAPEANTPENSPSEDNLSKNNSPEARIPDNANLNETNQAIRKDNRPILETMLNAPCLGEIPWLPSLASSEEKASINDWDKAALALTAVVQALNKPRLSESSSGVCHTPNK